MSLRNRLRHLAYGAALVLPILGAIQVVKAADDDKLSLVITGAGVQGFYKVVYESLNGILRDVYPDSAVTFRPSSPAGGVLAIADGEADLSLAAGAPEVQYAMAGEAPYPRSLKGEMLGVMRLFNTQTFHFLLNKEAADRYEVYSLADIAEKKAPLTIAINRKGNIQIVDVARDIFQAHGFTIEDLESWGGAVSWVASGVGLDQLQDRKADMFMNVRFVPDARVNEIARSVDLIWLEADRGALEKVAEKWSYNVGVVEMASYPDVVMKSDQPTIMQWSAMLAGTHVSEGAVYKMLKALADNAERVKQVHPSLQAFSAAEMAKVAQDLQGVPLHPGAERFYRERGVLQ